MAQLKRYDEEFKQSLVNLYHAGKTQTELCNDYGILDISQINGQIFIDKIIYKAVRIDSNSCGVLYPIFEWIRFRLYQPSMYSKSASFATSNVA